MVVCAPVVELVGQAFADDGAAAWALIARPRTGMLLANTVALVAVVSAACLVLGTALAFVATRIELPGRRLWWMALCLPLAVPSFVAAFAWLATWPRITGFWPLVAVLTVTTVPYVSVPTMAAIAVADQRAAEVARTLGRRPVAAFLTVTLPQVLPAALGGSLLVALYTLADFGAPAMLRYQTLTTGIYAQFTGGFDRTPAAATALVLAALAVLVVAIERYYRSRDRSAGQRPVHPLRVSARVRVGAMVLLTVVTLAGVGFPLAALGVRSLASDRYASAPVDLGAALLATVVVGAVAATVAVVMALPVSVLGARYRGRLTAMLESASYIGHALPGLVIGLAMVALSLRWLPGGYQSAAVLLLAYAILFLPKSIGASRSAFGLVSLDAENVSRTLGYGRWQTWLRVTVPAAQPGIVAGWVLVMTAVMKELPATLLLRPTGMETLATELWSKTTLGAYGAAAPIGLLLIVAGLAPAWLLARSLTRSMRESGSMREAGAR